MNFRLTAKQLVGAVLLSCVFAVNVFANGALGMVDVNSDPNGARVFLDGEHHGTTPMTVEASMGTHLVTLKLNGYIEASRTVELSKNASFVSEEFTLDPITGLILVKSEPAGAIVTIDGAEKGKTPLLVTDLRPGKYRFSIAKKGFLSIDKDVAIANRTPQKVFANLRTDSAVIAFTSTPSGAAVLINGTRRGTTPCKIDGLPPGKTVFLLKQIGFRPYHKALILTSGDKLSLNAIMQPMPANLAIHSRPSGAYVYINNQRSGKTPLTMAGLEPAEYRIRVELPGYDAMARTITLEPAADVSEEFRLGRTSGSIEITTRPAGARVIVDGRDMGTTSAEQGKSTSVSMPFKVDPLKAGSHKVSLIRRGYETKVITIHVTKSRTAISEHRLRRHVLVRTRGNPEGTHIGYLEKLYENGNVKLEIKPGVFRTFNKTQVKAIEPYVDSAP